MKKFVLFIVSFAILAIGCTAGLIYLKKASLINIGINLNQQLRDDINEKTLDLYGMHDENDIEIAEFKMQIEGKDISYPQISGLKDKEVEKKINDAIKSRISDRYQELVNDSSIENLDFYYYTYDRIS